MLTIDPPFAAMQPMDDSESKLAAAISKELLPAFLEITSEAVAIRETFFKLVDKLGPDRAELMESYHLRRQEIQERLLFRLEDKDPSMAALISAVLENLRRPDDPAPGSSI